MGTRPMEFLSIGCKGMWSDLIHPDDKDEACLNFENYLKNPQGMYENHFRMKHKDGHWVPIWSRGKTIRDEEGNITTRTIGTHIDVSHFRTNNT